MAAADATPPAGLQRIMRLALIGTAAGLFSGLFGVGGGVLIVPLLIHLLGYETRLATGTSLAAIVVIAAAAMASHGTAGTVRVDKGLMVGLPAVAGVLGGTWLQQRVHHGTIKILFALMITAIAVLLLVRG